jgi:hypothetical protein
MQNKSEDEPTGGRSTNFGSAHPIPIFRGIGRTSSWLLSKCLNATFKA